MTTGARVEVEIVARNESAKKGIQEVNQSLQGLTGKNREHVRDTEKGAEGIKGAFTGIAKTLGISPALLGKVGVAGAVAYAGMKAYEFMETGPIAQAQNAVRDVYKGRIADNLRKSTGLEQLDKAYTGILRNLAGLGGGIYHAGSQSGGTVGKPTTLVPEIGGPAGTTGRNLWATPEGLMNARDYAAWQQRQRDSPFSDTPSWGYSRGPRPASVGGARTVNVNVSGGSNDEFSKWIANLFLSKFSFGAGVYH